MERFIHSFIHSHTKVAHHTHKHIHTHTHTQLVEHQRNTSISNVGIASSINSFILIHSFTVGVTTDSLTVIHIMSLRVLGVKLGVGQPGAFFLPSLPGSRRESLRGWMGDAEAFLEDCDFLDLFFYFSIIFCPFLKINSLPLSAGSLFLLLCASNPLSVSIWLRHFNSFHLSFLNPLTQSVFLTGHLRDWSQRDRFACEVAALLAEHIIQVL